MRIALNVDSDNDYADDPSVCVVDLTPQLAAKILKRIERVQAAKAEDSETYQHTYFAWSGEQYFLSVDVDGQDIVTEERFSNNDFIELPETVVLDETAEQSLECPQMIVDTESVRFTAIPRHCSWYVRTREIPLSVIQEAAKPAAVEA